MSHAVFSPSSSKRWLTCPASISRIAALPARADNGSEASREGTTAHSLAQIALEHGCSAEDAMLLTEPEEGIEITDEMAAFVQTYVDEVNRITDVMDGDLFVEVKLPLVNVTGEDANGTADAIILSADRKVLYVIDLKYGAGVRVTAAYNTQATIYALAALNAIADASAVEEIVLMIVQPRNGGISEWATSREYLTGFAETVRDKVAEAEQADPPANPDGEACRWCDARTNCAEYAQWNASSISRACASQFPDMDEEDAVSAMFDCIAPGTGDSAKMALHSGDALSMLPHLENWCKALHVYARQKAEIGELPHGKLDIGTPTREWSDVSEVLAVFKTAQVRLADATHRVPLSPDELQPLVLDGTIGARTWKKLQPLIKEEYPPPRIIWLNQD